MAEHEEEDTMDWLQGQLNIEEPQVIYAHFFKTDPSYYSDDGKLMYTIATPVDADPPFGLRIYRYVVIPEDFWAGDKEPGTRLLTDEELYDTLKIQHNHRWKHVGYRSEFEPHILLFQYGPPPHVDPPTQEEIDRQKAIKEEEERKKREPMENYWKRERRVYEELQKLLPTSYPEDEDEIPFRTVDPIGRLVIPQPHSPLKSFHWPKSQEGSRPRQMNNHVKEWAIQKMKKALFERAQTSREDTSREDTSREETRGEETNREETRREETNREESS